MQQYQKLFEPWSLCGFPIANRICVPSLVNYTWADESGRVTEKHVAHYRELANGGAGLVIQEATAVCPEGRLTLDQLGIWEDGQKDGLRRIRDELKKAGMPAIVQLGYAGILAARPQDRVCPGDYTFEKNGAMRSGRGLTIEEIHRVERQFIDAGRRAYEIGYDGVELHASHGYLLSEFLNTRMNRRTDEYNAKDGLIVRNIMEGIRSATSPDFLIGVRMGVFEPSLEVSLANAKRLESLGAAFLDVYLGCDWAGDREMPEGYPFNPSIYGAQCVKQAVSVPVIAIHRICSGEQAEAVLQVTGVDMAAVGRGSLINHQWGNDVRDGRDPGRCFDCAACQWQLVPERCPGRKALEKQRESA